MGDQTAHLGAEPSQPVVRSAQPFVALGIVLLFGSFPVLPRGMVIAAAGAIALLTAVGWFRRWSWCCRLGSSAGVASPLRSSECRLSFGSHSGLATYAAVAWFGRGQRRAFHWFTAGTITRAVVLAAAASILLSAVAVIIWFLTVRPDINDLIETFVPDWHWTLLIAGGLLISMLNAAVEEMAYRGVLMDALDQSVGAG